VAECLSSKHKTLLWVLNNTMKEMAEKGLTLCASTNLYVKWQKPYEN
jgi:hypothetical protein